MYRGGVVLAVILVSAAVLVTVWHLRRRRDARWEVALQNPRWEASEVTFKARTDVGVALVARDGKRHLRYQTTRIGHVSIADPNWDIELAILRSNAKCKAEVLNQERDAQ